MSCSVTDPVSCVSSAANSVAGDAFDSIAHDFGRAADAAINWLWSQLSSSTAVHLGGQGFALDLAIVGAITGVVAVALFVIQVALSALRRDPSGLARAARGLVIAFIGGGAAIALTNVLLSAVDSLSAGVVQAAMGTDVEGMGSKILTGTSILQVANPAALLVLALAAIVAVLIVWFALTVRKVLVVVSAVFAPLAFAGSLADITVSWTRKWIEMMVALIVSKLVLVIVCVVGWATLANGAGQASTAAPQTVTQIASGLLILAVAGLSPWMALRVVHFTDDHFHRLHLLGSAATGGAQRAVAAPQKVAAWKSTAASLGASVAAGPGASTVARASTSPRVSSVGSVAPARIPVVAGTRSGVGRGAPQQTPPAAQDAVRLGDARSSERRNEGGPNGGQ